jgi:hypothetical protein
MTPDTIARQFTAPDGRFLCGRWGRPIVPVVFGVQDETLPIVKGAIEAVVAISGHRMSDTDPELGANLMLFFLHDWSDLSGVPGLERMIDGLHPTIARLQSENANQYRMFRFDADGAIKAVFAFVRLDAALADLPAEDIALDQATRMMLTWGPQALRDTPVLGRTDTGVVIAPRIAALLRAAYDPVLPAVARDSAHALRLAARMAA